ncbi:MAG TPA: ABC transporter ATP-binding protein [Clostridiales bacterium]|nr:ABC transporter ATP-binding protein [Clostridiales bacterium]
MIKLEELSFSYAGNEILDKINLEFETGKINTLIGTNGSGKTTLIKATSGIIENYRGRVVLNGKDIKTYSRKEVARIISVLPQSRNTPEISVADFVEHGRYPHLGYSRIMSKDDMEIVKKAMQVCGIYEFRNRRLTSLSGGEKQKVYIAMIIAQDADIMFLDEPTTYLDIKAQLDIIRIIKDINQSGKTIVLVLHDLILAMNISNCIGILEKGRLVFYGTPHDAYESGYITKLFGVQLGLINNSDGKNSTYYITSN